MFERCLEKGVRTFGFSTSSLRLDVNSFEYFIILLDADNKYMSAMRLASGFFASATNLNLDQHRDAFKTPIPNDWAWFFLRHIQLFKIFPKPNSPCYKMAEPTAITYDRFTYCGLQNRYESRSETD